MTSAVVTSPRYGGRHFEVLEFHVPLGKRETHALVRCQRDGSLYTLPTGQLLVQAAPAPL